MRKPEPFYSKLPRHFLCYSQSDFDYGRITEAGRRSKVLIICNTVKKACLVYAALEDTAGIRLLHSRLKQKHRRRLEEDILNFSKSDGVGGIWVTIQIVEASLDIDFDYLFTEMCTADSLLQRLGRCSRKRKYSASLPNVFVYETGNGVGSVYDEEIYGRSVQKISQYCGRIFTEREKNDYVCSVYDMQELKPSKYYRKFSLSLQSLEALPSAVFSAEEAKNKFRDIISVYAYYHICPRKIWYTANGISMESESENVQIGHLIDSNSYERERKHIWMTKEFLTRTIDQTSQFL